MGTLYSVHGLTSPHLRTAGHKQTLAHWGYSHVHVGGGGAISMRGRGSNGNMLHTAEWQNGHLQPCAH